MHNAIPMLLLLLSPMSPAVPEYSIGIFKFVNATFIGLCTPFVLKSFNAEDASAPWFNDIVFDQRILKRFEFARLRKLNILSTS